VLLYFWLKGHWFAAVIGMLLSWAGPGFLMLSAVDRVVPVWVQLSLSLATGLIGWIPWYVHRSMNRARVAQAMTAAPQTIQGITLIGRSASFNG